MIGGFKRVLCLVAHPDDLEPQAGGTIIRLVEQGAEVQIAHAITPTIDRHGEFFEHILEREDEGRAAGHGLGASRVWFMGLDPELFLHTQPNVQVFDKLTRDFEPDLIISHHEVDTQQDHVVMANIAQTVCRRNRINLWQITHSVPGGYLPHRPQPNLFVDITSVHERKMDAVRCYKSQVERYSGLFPDNWLEIIKARDRYYGGLLNLDGHSATRYAEGFVAAKMVWKETE